MSLRQLLCPGKSPCIMLPMKHHRFQVVGPSGSEYSVVFRPNPRAQRLILKIDPKTGGPVVTAPSARHRKSAENFVKAKAGWIENQLSRRPDDLLLQPGASIPIGGVPHELLRSGEKGRTRLIAGEPPCLDSPGAALTYPDRVERFLKIRARQLITERADIHAQRLGVDPRRISIRDTRTRWGSCSAKGYLNFSWRLVLAPPEILDYVVAHEVAHLIEMNHSSAFWNLVEKSYGPHRSARAWLRQNGKTLHAVGRGGSAGG
ncbi:MAG: hypothetical protein CMK06_01990 [Ponticaulis sp.]|nr:hypothetical protein [Ponticaulis sp.]